MLFVTSLLRVNSLYITFGDHGRCRMSSKRRFSRASFFLQFVVILAVTFHLAA